jgi:glycosyltransferase involved in cell wall biosynthesis
MPESISLSVVVPCYNPAPGWRENILSNYVFISGYAPATELIIVNDGSLKNFDPEATRQFFNAYENIKIISYVKNRGKGFALRKGVAASTGQMVIYTDVDFPYTKQSLQSVYNTLKEGHYNVVPGKRSDEYYKHLPPSRVRISHLLRFLIRSFLRIPTDDTQCGLKGFDQAGKKVFLNTSIDRFLFDLEFIFLSARKGLSIRPMDVELREGFELSTMPWKVLIQESWNFAKIFLQGISGGGK